jgi:glutathionyl-hydroquinone reductase
MMARINGLSSSDKTFIENIHKQILRRPFTRTGCGDCYKDAVIEMSIYLKNNEIMEKSNYLLNAGAILQSSGDPNVYTNSNLTDEAAERYLKDNPNRIIFFSAYPNDWKKRAGLESNSVTPEELTEAEKEFVSALFEKLKSGVTKTALKEEYKNYEIEEKKVTQRSLIEFLKLAEDKITPQL